MCLLGEKIDASAGHISILMNFHVLTHRFNSFEDSRKDLATNRKTNQ